MTLAGLTVPQSLPLSILSMRSRPLENDMRTYDCSRWDRGVLGRREDRLHPQMCSKIHLGHLTRC